MWAPHGASLMLLETDGERVGRMGRGWVEWGKHPKGSAFTFSILSSLMLMRTFFVLFGA